MLGVSVDAMVLAKALDDLHVLQATVKCLELDLGAYQFFPCSPSTFLPSAAFSRLLSFEDMASKRS